MVAMAPSCAALERTGCWACGADLLSTEWAHEVTCAGCGAVTSTGRSPVRVREAANGGAAGAGCDEGRGGDGRALRRVLQGALACVVPGVVLLIAGLAVAATFPCLVGTDDVRAWARSWPGVAAAVAVVQVLGNFASTVLADPAGPKGLPGVPALQALARERVHLRPGPQARFAVLDGCRVCVRPPCAVAATAKPAGAHHCRTCRRCVPELDHHCPFVANCIGRGNRRSFVLFLAWAVGGCGYALAAVVATAATCGTGRPGPRWLGRLAARALDVSSPLAAAVLHNAGMTLTHFVGALGASSPSLLTPPGAAAATAASQGARLVLALQMAVAAGLALVVVGALLPLLRRAAGQLASARTSSVLIGDNAQRALRRINARRAGRRSRGVHDHAPDALDEAEDALWPTCAGMRPGAFLHNPSVLIAPGGGRKNKPTRPSPLTLLLPLLIPLPPLKTRPWPSWTGRSAHTY